MTFLWNYSDLEPNLFPHKVRIAGSVATADVESKRLPHPTLPLETRLFPPTIEHTPPNRRQNRYRESPQAPSSLNRARLRRTSMEPCESTVSKHTVWLKDQSQQGGGDARDREECDVPLLLEPDCAELEAECDSHASTVQVMDPHTQLNQKASRISGASGMSGAAMRRKKKQKKKKAETHS
ncbi:hypothetical protein BLNAU_9634 [Blattamonas nauphoetae]|uniref:Uncharacterized protein n=1 Tax=Blattamonas nauphoetae TaxID=2049346 RepID=A0ABQ9XV93_9EUKA|nr:hypothetical protein BLNAU_9634 [Blattamonas nauphoetae]